MSVESLPLNPPDLTQSDLREIVASSPAVAYVAARRGDFKTLYVSPNVETILGYDAESFLRNAKFWQRHVHPDDVEAVLAQFARLPGVGRFTCEYRFLHSDGRWLNVQDSVSVVSGEKGAAARILGYWTDVTAQKAIGDALTQSESHLHVIADSFPAFISSIDSQQRYRFVNRAYAERWSKTQDEIVGMTIRELLGETRHEKVLPSVDRALSGERVIFEYESTYADGGLSHFRSTLVPECGADGTVLGFFALAEDVTQQRRAEREIHESQAMLVAFMESSTDSHIILDQDLKCPDLNEKAASRIGLPKSDIIGRAPKDFSPHARSSGRLEKYRDVLTTGRPFNEEVELSVHGAERRLVVSAFRIQPGRLRLISRNITERARAERALNESEQRFRDLIDSVTDRIWETDAGLRITMFTGEPQYLRDAVLGKRPWELPGLNQDTDEWRAHMADFRARRPFRDYRETHRGEHGRVRYLRTSGKPYFDADGGFAGFRGICVDDTVVVERDAAIREKDDILLAFMDSATDSFLILDNNLTFVDANRRVFENLRLSRGQFVGRHLLEVAPSAKAAGREQLYGEVLRTGEPARFEFSAKRRSTGRHARLSATAFRIRESLLGIMLHDITDIVEAKRAVEVSEARYRSLYETAPGGIMTANRDGTILEANPAAHRMFGYEPGEMHGLNVVQLRADTPEGKSRGHAAFTRFRRDEKVENSEQQRLRKDGSLFWITLSIDPVFDESGMVIESRSVVIDITERRKMEEALAARDRHMRAILDNIADAVVTMDVGGVIESVNPAAEAMFGFTADELLGEHVTVLMAEPDRSAHDSYVDSYLRNGIGKILGIGPRAVTARRKDGRLFPIELSLGSLLVEGRQVFVGAMRDNTERRKMEVALRAAKEEAERANSAKTRFLANASHELRTLLNAILGFSGLLGREIHGAIGSPKYLEYAADIGSSGEHLLSLITDLLDVAKIESGRVDLVETEIDVDKTVDRCQALVADQASRGQITFSKTISPEVGLLHGDRRIVTQILLNLLSNAVKFTEAGGCVDVAAAIGSNGELVLAVKDTGVGLAPEDIPKALETFGQVENPLSGAHKGTGLGLPLVQSFAEMHGGRLEIESELGVGTTVSVVFPRERVVHTAS